MACRWGRTRRPRRACAQREEPCRSCHCGPAALPGRGNPCSGTRCRRRPGHRRRSSPSSRVRSLRRPSHGGAVPRTRTFFRVLLPRLYSPVPPTVMWSSLTVGMPTPTGTFCPALPQVPMPSSSARSFPTMDMCFNASGPWLASFTIARAAVSGARIVAGDGELRLSIDVPVYPAAAAFADYRIADGLTVPPYSRPLGEGNGDGHAAPGESFAVLLPDAGALRAAELFTNDTCVDNTVRISEGGTRISVPVIRSTCEPGHRIQMLARIGLAYFALEIPVWYRNP